METQGQYQIDPHTPKTQLDLLADVLEGVTAWHRDYIAAAVSGMYRDTVGAEFLTQTVEGDYKAAKRRAICAARRNLGAPRSAGWLEELGRKPRRRR